MEDIHLRIGSLQEKGFNVTCHTQEKLAEKFFSLSRRQGSKSCVYETPMGYFEEMGNVPYFTVSLFHAE